MATLLRQRSTALTSRFLKIQRLMLYIPLPTSLHVEWAIRSAEKGKHILLEKPVAMNVAEFDKIAAACEANGVQLMDGTMWAHHPRTAKLREFLFDPDCFGQLKSIFMELIVYLHYFAKIVQVLAYTAVSSFSKHRRWRFGITSITLVYYSERSCQ
ncbi:NAD(P)-binding domain protein [Raphanus sativus]|nr:NAD(P)-binding domain protein [Raphanus sativus]KAJ4868356.1 NAD(P)-binding domain protein [Raphanus sativus]KAJ4870821.1 NAD(P)-binding domain protein [Raphanus sativus]